MVKNMKEVIIVGAGTGGLSVARELSKNNNLKITIIEKGILADTSEAYKYYDVWDKNEMEPPTTSVFISSISFLSHT